MHTVPLPRHNGHEKPTEHGSARHAQARGHVPFGLYIDEVLTMRRGSTDYYYHADDMHNVVKLTDNTGAVLESYDYSDYGLPEFFDAAGNALTGTAYANPYLFTGRRWDAELGYYYFRNRYLDPVHGRFARRDPLGLWGDPLNLGNGYTYAGSNPWSLVDPLGLCSGNQGGIKGWLLGLRDAFVAWGDSLFLDDGVYEPKPEDFETNTDYHTYRLAIRGDQAGNDAVNDYFLRGDPTRMSAAEFASAVGTDAKAHVMEGAVDGAETVVVEVAVAVGTEGIGRVVVAGAGLIITGIVRETGDVLATMSVQEIRFSQRSVSPRVREYARMMMAGEWDFARSPIHVMEREGRWVSYDNRRLMAARLAGIDDIPVQIVNPNGLSVRPGKTWEQAFTERFTDPRNVRLGGAVPNDGIWELPRIAE